MAMDTGSLMGIALYGSLTAAERRRVGDSLLLTVVPGPPATKAAMSSVAVGMQARDSLRRERRVAAETITAVESVLRGDATPDAAFAARPELKDLAPAQLAQRLDAAANTTIQKIVDAAALLVQAAINQKNAQPVARVAEYEPFLERVSDSQRQAFVQ